MKSKYTKKVGNYTLSIDPNIKDHSNDPFVIRKNERAEAFIAKNGLPKEFVERSNGKPAS